MNKQKVAHLHPSKARGEAVDQGPGLQSEFKRVTRSTLSDASESKSCEKASVVEVGKNYLILRNIFEHVPLKDLKSCRGMSRLWYKEATKILRKNYVTCSIRIEPSGPGARATLSDMRGICCGLCCLLMGRNPAHRSHTDTLSGLTELIQTSNSRMFPCNNFEFSSSLLKLSSFQNFLKGHGANIKALELDMDDHGKVGLDGTVELVRNLFERQLPKLEYLSFDEIHRDWLTSKALNSNLVSRSQSQESQLKNLKILDLSHLRGRDANILPTDFLSYFIKVAVNLKALHCNTCDDRNLKLLLELDVIHLLKKFSFEFTVDKNRMNMYREIARKNPKFEEIKEIELNKNLLSESSPWSESSNQIGEILSNVFDSCADTLKCITSFLPFGLISNLTLPHFSNLRDFSYGNEMNDWSWNTSWQSEQVFSSTPSTVPVFPRGSNLLEQWPLLQKVEIWFNHDVVESQDLKEIFLYDTSPHESVKTLLVSFDLCEEKGLPTAWVQYFCQLFPRVEKADFRTLHDFPSASQHFWTLLKDLVKLTVSIHVERDHGRPYSEIEAAFTGFTTETCTKLYKASPKTECKTMPKEEIQNLRVFPSILDLKQLKTIRITFHIHDTESWEWKTRGSNVNTINPAGDPAIQHEINDGVAAAEVRDEGSDNEDGDDSASNEAPENLKAHNEDDSAADLPKSNNKRDDDSDTNSDQDRDSASDSSDTEWDDDDDDVLSHVTWIFAFRMCPQLQPEFVTMC